MRDVHLGRLGGDAGGRRRRPRTAMPSRTSGTPPRSMATPVGVEVDAADAERGYDAAPVGVGAVQRAAHELVLGHVARGAVGASASERAPTTS